MNNDKLVEHTRKHEFALFVHSLLSLLELKSINDSICLIDARLVHRMIHVLRLQIGDTCIIFDQKVYSSVSIISFSGKKSVTLKLHTISKTTSLAPTIIFLLPLLKREDYEAALYGLTELGVNIIQPVFTQKTARSWQDRERERAHRIIISAAEQSKNFAYPELKDPVELTEALDLYRNIPQKIYFDVSGESLRSTIKQMGESSSSEMVLLIGPEGDLTFQEKLIVRENDFNFCALTPTVIRAVQAASLGAGLIRSLFYS